MSKLLAALVVEREERRVAAERERQEREEERAAAQAQVDAMLRVMQEQSQLQAGRGSSVAPTEPLSGPRSDPKVERLCADHDIEAELSTFEHMMEGYDIPEERWAFWLAPKLTGPAQLAHTSLPNDEAKVYVDVKRAILMRYDVDGETYRQRFRSAVFAPTEPPREYAARLR